MAADLAAGVVERELGAPPDRRVRGVGPGADRRGVDRSGPPGHHPRRPGRGGQGPVPGRRRRHPRRPRQRRADVRRHGPGAARASSPARWSRRSGPGSSRSSTTPSRPATPQLFADFYRGHPFIHVPGRGAGELSTRPGAHHRAGRGRPLRRAGSRWDQDERDLAAETIYRFVFRSLYRLRGVQRRPPPGQLPVPAGRAGDVPRLRAGQALHRRRGRRLRRHDPGAW